jgi:hypothetical protein
MILVVPLRNCYQIFDLGDSGPLHHHQHTSRKKDPNTSHSLDTHTIFKHNYDSRMSIFATPVPTDPTVLALRNIVTSESSPLAARFRALFSLKHLAALSPPTDQSIPALEAIAAALVSPSALLKHELAYCLGQSGKPEAVRYLEACVEDRAEDDMCRHEAAEALGALGFDGSLGLLKARRDDEGEVQVVRETAELAVERIEWAASDAGKAEKLRARYVIHDLEWKETEYMAELTRIIVTSRPSTLHHHLQRPQRHPRSQSSRRLSSTHLSHSSSATEQCSPFATLLRLPTFLPPSLLCTLSPVACTTHLPCSVTRSHSSLANYATLHPFPA